MSAPTIELPGFPRADRIRCPECRKVQDAQIHFYAGDPWTTYIHNCEACGYIIMESEWGLA